MKINNGIEFISGSNEERLPDFDADFPCLTSCATLHPERRPSVPWHWHKAAELVYIRSGAIEYSTPAGQTLLDEGCAALVNSNTLHATRLPAQHAEAVHVLHLFDPVFLAGAPGSLIDHKYIRPLTDSPSAELIALYPDHPEHAAVLAQIRASFALAPDTPGYELRLRGMLCSIWLQILALVKDSLSTGTQADPSARVKVMMSHIHEHYAEPISVKALSQAAICSERECYRAFHTCLHMTPAAYLQSYRLQMACRMLAENRESLTTIAHSCGFGSSSYLGKVFRAEFGMTPMQYRQSQRNRSIFCQKSDSPPRPGMI